MSDGNDRIAIILVGPQGAGKSTLFEYMKTNYHPYFVDTDKIVDFVGSTTLTSVNAANYWNVRNTTLTRAIDATVARDAALHGRNVVYEMTNLYNIDWLTDFDVIKIYFVVVADFPTLWGRVKQRNQVNTNNEERVFAQWRTCQNNMHTVLRSRDFNRPNVHVYKYDNTSVGTGQFDSSKLSEMPFHAISYRHKRRASSRTLLQIAGVRSRALAPLRPPSLGVPGVDVRRVRAASATLGFEPEAFAPKC